ncbi:putative nucleotidyltransferase-like protein [Novosphingobium sp. PhB165]|uniref:nucleotidyltransferase family protein n=1 Tax=Novosphingobium sp. PhB165 TaxID=2485105 RepID=UPI0010ECE8AB|nr:nucleotidyltransferase family protein [Novosphingobium sp. PhB165]TCM15329.1 putative nucleotidyltransferase-like protein [Novosphingobium sp. PhB165]
MIGIRTFAAALDGRIPVRCDWEDLIGRANRTMTTASLGSRLARRPDVPEDALAFLAAVVEANTERNRRLMLLLEEVLGALADTGPPPILIKGAALLVELGAPAARGRILGDIDLMLPESAMPGARSCLGRLGFRIHYESGLDGAPLVLYRSSDVGMLDLHCRTKGSNPRFDYPMLSAHCRRVEIGRQRALQPSPAAQAAVLVSHDQLQELDYWRGLVDMRHLVDLAGLARSGEGIDWQELDGFFTARQARRALRTQLLTLRSLFAVPVPQEYCSGLWPRIQHRRQLLQADWPGLRWPLTLAALALQMPRGIREDPSPAPHGWARDSLPALLHRAHHLTRRAVRSPGPGKYC